MSVSKLNIVSGLEKKDNPEEELKVSPTMPDQLKSKWMILAIRSSAFFLNTKIPLIGGPW